MTRAGFSLVAVMIVLAAAGCDESLSEFAGPTPDLEPTFSSIQQNIFNSSDSAGRAACISCHNTQFFRQNGNLNLTEGVSYTSLINVASSGKRSAVRVIPGDPEGSYLVQKLQGSPGIVGVRMPQLGPPYLTANQIAIIRRWIELGAANN
jgi:hypothetical protein